MERSHSHVKCIVNITHMHILQIQYISHLRNNRIWVILIHKCVNEQKFDTGSLTKNIYSSQVENSLTRIAIEMLYLIFKGMLKTTP